MALKKILYFDHTASLGGGEIALLHLVKKLDRSRFYPVVALCSDGPLYERLQAAGIETHILPIAPSVTQSRKDALGATSLLRLKDIALTLAYVQRLARFIRSQKIALVHTNSLKADIIGGFAAKLARTPVLWHVRDRIDEDYLPKPVVHLFRSLCRTLPDFVIANSQATLKTIAQPPLRRSAAVYSGIELPSQSSAAPAIASATQPPHIGLVGRISPWKGQHIFLQAAAIVRAEFPTARFQIIGAALFDELDYEREIHALTESLGLEECVEFLGFRNDVPALIADLDMLVHASTTGEPFGQVVVQGMAAGKPVVATDGGGIPEIVLPNETGMLVPMSDAPAMAEAIIFLLKNPERAAEMGRLGYRRVCEHFTIDITTRQVEDIYEQIWRRRRAPARPSQDPSQEENAEPSAVRGNSTYGCTQSGPRRKAAWGS